VSGGVAPNARRMRAVLFTERAICEDSVNCGIRVREISTFLTNSHASGISQFSFRLLRFGEDGSSGGVFDAFSSRLGTDSPCEPIGGSSVWTKRVCVPARVS